MTSCLWASVSRIFEGTRSVWVIFTVDLYVPFNFRVPFIHLHRVKSQKTLIQSHWGLIASMPDTAFTENHLNYARKEARRRSNNLAVTVYDIKQCFILLYFEIIWHGGPSRGLTKQLTPCSRDLLQQSSFKKSPIFYETTTFITAFTKARYLPLSWAR